MPAKFRTKNYSPGSVYYIYNKTIENRKAFEDAKDFEMFESVCKSYLLPVEIRANRGFKSERPYRVRHKQEMNLSQRIEVWAYSLTPGRFNFILKQNDDRGITDFMRRAMTGYAMYYIKSRDKRGGLWEGVYRAERLESREDILFASKRIHMEPLAQSVRRFGPLETINGPRPEEYPYSSFREFMAEESSGWVHTLPILELFNKDRNEYAKFVTSASYKL